MQQLDQLVKNKFFGISLGILDKTKLNFREVLTLNQWKKTDIVTDWFKAITEKNLH